MDAPKKKSSFLQKLRNHYRLLILNEDSLEELFSLRLTPLAIINLFGLSLILFAIIIVSTIVFTPIKEYIPGYSDAGMRESLVELRLRTDSLEVELEQKTKYIDNLGSIMNGEVGKDDNKEAPLPSKNSATSTSEQNKKHLAEDSLLRLEIEAADKYGISLNPELRKKDNISSVFFFSPLKGSVSQSFNEKEQHFGVDIVSLQNEAIKSALDGTVIAAFWNPETGHVIEVQHSNNLVSIYKHNSVLLKKAGDVVKAGEAIAIIGNSGELSSGPHLHFELWFSGRAVNPQDYISF